MSASSFIVSDPEILGGTPVFILHDHPEAGRMVPEYRSPRIREIVYRPYRIIYRLDIERQIVEIARVWHAARGAPSV